MDDLGPGKRFDGRDHAGPEVISARRMDGIRYAFLRPETLPVTCYIAPIARPRNENFVKFSKASQHARSAFGRIANCNVANAAVWHQSAVSRHFLRWHSPC
jgi:hypothetical protein